jgi:SnoaL-like domain
MNDNSNSLESRLRAIEDRLDILNLIASHPPSADTGADYYTVQVYTEDGVFDRGEHLTGARGNKEIAAIMQMPGHQAAISGGLAHFAGLPHIAIDGDSAVVTSYLQILTPQMTGEAVEVPNHGASKGFRIHRVAANRWELTRTPQGWKIRSRTLRPLDGSEPARQILRRALEPYRQGKS